MQKLKRVIKDNSGASIMFVLGVALLLLAISTSALVAASASAGAGIAKQTRNQLNLYADSVQKTLMYSLMSKYDEGKNILATDDMDKPKTLSGQILRAIYHSATSVTTTASFTSFSIPFSIDDITLTLDGDNSFTCTVDIDVEQPFVQIYNGISTATSIQYLVNARITVQAEVFYRSTLTSLVTYDYSGGLLEKDTVANTVLIEEAGEWRFVSHEKIESQT